jgi:hypothetical protein
MCCMEKCAFSSKMSRYDYFINRIVAETLKREITISIYIQKLAFIHSIIKKFLNSPKKELFLS